MPTIANPRTMEAYESRQRHADAADAPTSSAMLRMKVAAKRATLTEQLAEGANPESTPELALRASQLTSARRRRQMARTLRRTITEARQPSKTRVLISIVNRYAVLTSVDAFQATIGRLASPEPVTAKGMAMLERLITDGGSSPLYNRAEPGTLRRQLLVATSALDTAPVELPIAA
jgi:hypothetical protein